MFKMRKALAIVTLSVMCAVVAAPVVMAAEEETEKEKEMRVEAERAATISQSVDNSYSTKKFIALAMGLGLGLAAAGGALGQGRCAAAALDGIARNPGASDKIFMPMILGLALIESLVIYSLVISFTLNGYL